MPALGTPEGVKEFNMWALSILGKLWEEFPRPLDFYITFPSGVRVTSDRTREGMPLGDGLFSNSDLFIPTMDWLTAEGFVRAEGNGAGQYAQVSLTAKGFTVLNETPRSVKGVTQKKSLGALIGEAIAARAVDTMSKLLSEMLLPRS